MIYHSTCWPFYIGIFIIILVVNLPDVANGLEQDYKFQETYDKDCKFKPKGSVCIQYIDGFVWLVNDSILSWELDKSSKIQTAEGLQAYYHHILNTDQVKVELKGDIDNDGIIDSLDGCPTQPEIFNGFLDSDGCPDVVPSDSNEIPVWIKNNAGWWANDEIDDDSFIQGIQYLIRENILKIPLTQPDSDSNSDSDKIPDWIKNNALWWSQEQISDDDFLKGIQYLVEKRIIKV